VTYTLPPNVLAGLEDTGSIFWDYFPPAADHFAWAEETLHKTGKECVTVTYWHPLAREYIEETYCKAPKRTIIVTIRALGRAGMR
jgi:hypothetical protein